MSNDTYPERSTTPAEGEGKVVVVTGANEGIGYHTLIALLDRGYRVAGLDVAGENLRSLQDAHPEHVRYYECDVTSDADVETAIEAIVDEWGRIDVLLNNAGIFTFGLFENRSIEDTRREFEVNYFGYLRTIRAVLPHMRARNQGIIHNVSSGVALTGTPGLSGYASTKGAIEALTRTLQLELRRENVSCTIVYPPFTKTRAGTRLATLGITESTMEDPAVVGRKLAGKIESTRPVIAVDWTTKIGMAVARRFPSLARTIVGRSTGQLLETGDGGTTVERQRS